MGRSSIRPATLAAITENEGAWDNPWDLQQKKIASLQEQLGMERDPIQRLILRRELGQQYVNGGASEAGIDTLEQLLAEYGPKLPQRDIETRILRHLVRLLPAAGSARFRGVEHQVLQLRDRLNHLRVSPEMIKLRLGQGNHGAR